MAPELESESNEQPAVVHPFHRRFDIKVNKEEAEKRFINRILNMIELHLPSLIRFKGITPYITAMYNVSTKLGREYDSKMIFHDYVRHNFNDCIQSLEALYEVFVIEIENDAKKFSEIIKYCLPLSELDLEIGRAHV